MSGWPVSGGGPPGEPAAGEWEDLVSAAGAPVSHRPGWLGAVEHGGLTDVQARHAQVREHGRLVAAAPAYLTRYCPKLEMYRSRYVQAGLGDAPMLVAHSMYAQSSEIIAVTEPARRAALRALEESWAAAGEADVLVFPLVPADAPLLSALTPARGYHAGLLSATNILPVAWGSFEEYLASRRSARRINIRQAARRSEAAGVRVEISPGVPDPEPIARLVARTAERHGSPVFFTAAYIDAIMAHLKGTAECITLTAGSQLILGCILLFDGIELTPWCIGLDYEVLPQYDHYNYLYTTLIRYAIERGARRINFGRGTYYIKHKYGCIRKPVYIVAKSWRDDPALASWINAIDARGREELAGAPGG